MAQVRINPRSKEWPVLEAGKYGPGTPNPAECEVMAYECPSESNPNYDPDGKRGPYAFFHVQVRRENGALVNVRHYEPVGEETGSRAIDWLTNIGVQVADDGLHDDKAPLGKKCIVEAGEPSVSNDRRYTRLRNLLGVS